MSVTYPRIIIAALKGGSGKTILSLGLAAVWREMGYRVAPFKKGPDFIDAGWLAFAAGRPCYNLDPFLLTEDKILESFLSHSDDADISIVEGNRGLFDGLDLEGRCSTAEVAKLLNAPVLLIIDVSMATRTMAAVVKGCQAFDPALNIAGVILNRVGSSRQETLIRDAVKRYCGITVVGAVPKLKNGLFPERHMGLVPYQEREHAEKAVSWTRSIVKKNLQLDAIWEIANNVEMIETFSKGQELSPKAAPCDGSPKIGFIRDKAFWFYYPENLEQLEKMGAELVEINAISDKELPQIDALYIGGGFPETQAQALADNQSFRNSLRDAIEKDLPVYAECGGFMYLGESLVIDADTYPMVGTIPVKFVLRKRPQGHGYTLLKADRSNPYYPVGEILKGHEFHYSEPVLTKKKDANFVFKVSRGHGVNGLRDGICMKNLLATYSHVHAAGNPLWARGVFRAAVKHKKNKEREST